MEVEIPLTPRQSTRDKTGLHCPQCGVAVEVEKELWIAHTRQLACRCKVCSIWWDFSTSEEGKVIDVTYVSEEV